MKEVTKQEVEELLKTKISDEQFEEALQYAKRKQERIYKLERRPVVLQHWYLATLTKEYVNNFAFSRYTMDLCVKLCNMEKECPVEDRNTLTHNHIVAQPIA